MESQNPFWMKKIIEEKEREGTNTWPIQLLKGEGRQTVWIVCHSLGVSSHGIPGQACRLLERYLCVRTRELMAPLIDLDEMKRVQRLIKSQLLLFLVCSIQLASKMYSTASGLKSRTVQRYLIKNGVFFTIDKINQTEHEVFGALGYQIPLFTSVEAAELIATEIGLPSNVIEHVGTLVDLVEYSRDKLVCFLEESAALLPTSDNFDYNTLRKLHISAGSVATGIFYHVNIKSISTTTFVARLQRLTELDVPFLRYVADAILKVLRMPEDRLEPAIKRRKTD